MGLDIWSTQTKSVSAGCWLRMNLIQNNILSELASLNLFAKPPSLSRPVHYLFGEDAPLTPPKIAKQLPLAISAPQTTVSLAPNAGHMVHFDQSELVRSIVVRASLEKTAEGPVSGQE